MYIDWDTNVQDAKRTDTNVHYWDALDWDAIGWDAMLLSLGFGLGTPRHVVLAPVPSCKRGEI